MHHPCSVGAPTRAPFSVFSRWLCRREHLWSFVLLCCCLLLPACGNDAQERAKHMKAGASQGASSTETPLVQVPLVQVPEVSPSGSAPGEETVTTTTGAEGAPAQSPPVSAPPSEVGKLGVVLAGALNVRSAPSGQAQRVNLLHCGDVVRIEAQEGSWYQVRVDELQGWSHMAWLNPVRAGGRMPPCGRSRRADEEQHSALPTVPVRAQAEPTAAVAAAPPPVAQGAVVETVPPPPVKSEKTAAQASPGSGNAGPGQGTAALPPASPKPVTTASPAEPSKAHGKGPASILLSLQGRAAKVNFPHHLHNQQFECAKCHHPVSAEVKASTPKERACRSCHVAADAKGISPVTNKEAFHNTCKNCHVSSGAGPTRCAECHTSGG
ncbi:MAG: SH3 domain-containing protein [Myxococcota bacterium]